MNDETAIDFETGLILTSALAFKPVAFSELVCSCSVIHLVFFSKLCPFIIAEWLYSNS